MSASTFLVNVEPPEIRVAELRGGRLFDFDIERDGRMLGNIYWANVENIVPAMDAAFVNIGQKRNALLYIGDLPGDIARGTSIGAVLKHNQNLLVQIARPAVGEKGARVTAKISLPGRFCILISHSDTTGVSKRIESEDERSQLRRICDKLRPLDKGLIIRTEAEGASEAQIIEDVRVLEDQMATIKAASQNAIPPQLLHRDLGLLGRLARDRLNEGVAAIWIDSPEVFESFGAQVSTFAPAAAPKINLFRETAPIFNHFGAAKDIQDATKRSVELPHGGSLVIDEAEALTAIDINSGSFVGKKRLSETVLAVNLAAVEEITRQLRLRDIGGIVVIDFIDMERVRDRVQVLNSLESALKNDRARTRIVQISPSGLVEMTRRRESQTLRHMLNEPCQTCGGLGYVARPQTVAIDARRKAREMAAKNRGTGILAIFHPETATHFLGEDAEFTRDLEAQIGVEIWVRVDERMRTDEAKLERILPGVPLARDLVEGALLPFSGAICYPADAPIFAVLGRSLVQLEGEIENADGEKLVEILEAGRHFARARVSGS